MVRSGKLATNTNPQAVTSGAFLFAASVTREDPVSVMPLAARPGTTPSGTLHRISPSFMSIATRDVHGGLIAGRPSLERIRFSYVPKYRVIPGGGGSRSIPPPTPPACTGPDALGLEIYAASASR